MRTALNEFLEGWTVWPTCDEFARGGGKGLREAVGRIHGPAWWAREMGLPGGNRSRGGVRTWTDDRIRATLAEFFQDRSTWPTAREFDDAGLHALREALRHYAGPARWSAEMGVAWTPSAPRARKDRRRTDAVSPDVVREWPKWNARTIEAALAEFLAGRDEWPRHAEFVDAGRKGLYHAVLKHGGTRVWAERMGVAWVSRRGGTPPRWTEERVRERLTPVLADRNSWPLPAEFAALGATDLLNAARRLGGVKHWAMEFGLKPPPNIAEGGAGARRTGPIWDDGRIAREIEPLIRELGRWPTKSEFRRAGLGKALAAVYSHGGSGCWQRRFGVAPREPTGPVPSRQRWTAELVEAELRRFCGDRRGWPAYAEFRAAGRTDLYHAAARHGGIRFWQIHLGRGGSPSA